MPVVEVDHAVAAVDLDDRRDQRDHVRADLADVRRVVDREAIGELHQRGRRAGLGRVDRAGDVVDRRRLRDQRLGFRVVHADACADRRACARRASFSFWSASSFSSAIATAIISRPSSVLPIEIHLHARARRREHRGSSGRRPPSTAGCPARRRRRRAPSRGVGTVGRGRQVVGQRRVELRSGRVLADLRRVGVVDRLRGIARVLRRRRVFGGCRDRRGHRRR